jgi:regulator of CtrA degradation
MPEPATINPRIIEGLYGEALALSDEVRHRFALSGRLEPVGGGEDLVRVALSCEGLRTTTRMMHAIAWLLNHRAYFMGELTEFQLRRYGSLSADSSADPEQLGLLDDSTRELIETTERFYARLRRLDNRWRNPDGAMPSALTRLRERLDNAVAG